MKKFLPLLFVAGTLMLANTANADVCNPDDIDFDPIDCGNNGGGSGAPGAPAVPVDGGASVLFAAGAAYGMKRLREKKAK